MTKSKTQNKSKYKSLKFLILGFGFALNFVLCHLCFAQEWKELRGDHFIIFYGENDKFASEVLRKAEEGYNRIASDLGYVRYSNFWQWEKRVKVTIYPTKEAYLAATRQKEWSEGSANYIKKEIAGYSGSQGFVDSILPHEIAHLIFRDFVGFQGEVPVWLDEGVAQWQEPSKRQLVKYFIKKLHEAGRVLSLKDLTQTDVRFVEGSQEAQDFYVQAASVVDFLIARFGTDNFTNFCRQLRDGKALDEALRHTYSPRISGLADLEKQWLSFVEALEVTSRRYVSDSQTTVFFNVKGE